MKPLQSAPLTSEDQAIWFEVIVSLLPQLSMLGHLSKSQDRRDAELMRWAQCEGRWIRTQYGVIHYGEALGLWHIDLGGAACPAARDVT